MKSNQPVRVSGTYYPSCATADFTVSACLEMSNFVSISRIVPDLSIKNVVRSTPMYVRPINFFSFHTPNCSHTVWSGSARIGKGRLYLSTNFACFLTGSGLTPKITASIDSNAGNPSLNPQACAVHPGVSDFG